MSVSKNFLDQLDRLIILSDETCKCDEVNGCKSCQAKEKVEQIQMEVAGFLEEIERY